MDYEKESQELLKLKQYQEYIKLVKSALESSSDENLLARLAGLVYEEKT